MRTSSFSYRDQTSFIIVPESYILCMSEFSLNYFVSWFSDAGVYVGQRKMSSAASKMQMRFDSSFHFFPTHVSGKNQSCNF